MARDHRIVQTRDFCVYRLFTDKNYEMQMFNSSILKLGLDLSVLTHQRQNIEYDGSIDVNPNNKSKPKSKREMQAKEIDKRLKKGAYDVFWDEDDTESQQFMETDIDQLLERSSSTVTYGSLRQSTMISGLGRFSKASFLHQLEMEMARMLTLM